MTKSSVPYNIQSHDRQINVILSQQDVYRLEEQSVMSHSNYRSIDWKSTRYH